MFPSVNVVTYKPIIHPMAKRDLIALHSNNDAKSKRNNGKPSPLRRRRFPLLSYSPVIDSFFYVYQVILWCTSFDPATE